VNDVKVDKEQNLEQNNVVTVFGSSFLFEFAKGSRGSGASTLANVEGNSPIQLCIISTFLTRIFRRFCRRKRSKSGSYEEIQRPEAENDVCVDPYGQTTTQLQEKDDSSCVGSFEDNVQQIDNPKFLSVLQLCRQ
jgi:hypothetical protein